MSEQPRRYGYVGPADVRAAARGRPPGREITAPGDLDAWLAAREPAERAEPFTFVVAPAGTLLLAPRRGEHVACAGGSAVLSAGEIAFARERGRWAAAEISNQSTGYCPDTASWPAVAAALDRAGIAHPGHFTHPIVFRRCPRCRERNIVRDGHFRCALCDAELPAEWNLGPGDAAAPPG